MGRRPWLASEDRRQWRAAAVITIAVALGAGWVAFARESPLRYTGVARLELALPSGTDRLRAVQRVRPATTDDVGNAPLDRALLEESPFGGLPRIGPDGRRPFSAYARPFNFEDRRPKVAVLLLGLGLQAGLLDAALALPGPISLQFSPYAPDLPALLERARRAGHEVLLDLSMEPSDDPAGDQGARTLLADNPRDENLERLAWLLARAPGYIALAGGGAWLAGSEQGAAVLDVLARRGQALIEVGGRRLAPAAAAAGLPYASASHAIDENRSGPSIDEALARLEAEALAGGSALAVAQSYPVSLERLRRWAATLDDKGLVLAPVSAVLVEQAGLAQGMPTSGRRTATRSEG